MAWTQRRERIGKITWTVRYRDPAGKTHSRTFDRETGTDPDVSAKAFKAKIENELNKKTWTNLKKAKVTVQSWADDHWLPVIAHRKPKNIAGYRSLLKTHVYPQVRSVEARPGGSRTRSRLGHRPVCFRPES